MLSTDFEFEKCIPTEEDFATVLEGKKTGAAWKVSGHDDGNNRYEMVRRFITAVLLDWPYAGKYIQDILLRRPYDKTDLRKIMNYVAQREQVYRALYTKYRAEALAIGRPEEIAQQARDSRKGEITVNVKNPNGGFFRIIEYSMKYGDNNPSKKQTGARMHLYINKKQGNVYGISVRGSTIYGSNRTELDEPFFATEQEARDFIANIDHNHIDTAVSLEDWRFVISDKPVDYAWDPDTRTYIKKADLKGAKRINTVCGPCYMLDKCRFFENLQEKIVHLSNGDWQVQSEKGRNMGTYDTKKEAEKRLGQVEYFKHMNETIEKHDTLNQKLFDGMQLKPEVRKKAEEVVNEFLRILAEDEVKITVRDVILTGSNASYNYTKDSDIDLHILAKTIDLDDPEKLYSKLYNCYRRIFESKFDISFYGIPVEVYVETEDNPVVSNGIYSVMYDKWIKEPQEAYVPEIDQKAIDIAAKPWIDKANEIIKKVDDNMPDGEEEIDEYINNIYEMRQKGIYHSKGSEFSLENLTFKEVRNAGLLDKLKELRNKVIERRLSLDEGIKYLDEAHEFKDYGTGEAHDKDVIDIKKASTFGTQDLLDGSADSVYDGVVYDIVEMTPTQYFELCSKIQGMSPDEIIEFISTDERQIKHIKDVILKYGKKLPLPFISFSDNIELSGQEGRHRMYALGEMFGWDEDFPVMLIQDASSKKTLGELLHESITEDFYLDEKTRRDYVIKIAQIAHDQPIVHQNGIFELHNISEQDANSILSTLRRMPWVEYVSKVGDRYDYSKMSYQGIPALKLNITGKIKIN